MKIPQELIDKIKSGNCVLFIGAGASKEAGAPSSKEIVEGLSQKYLNGKHKEKSLERVSSLIEAKPGLGRKILTGYLLNKLSDLKPSQAHLSIPAFEWVAVYTTNYDDLIEQSYRYFGKKVKVIIDSKDEAIHDKNSNYQLVYKPHGSINSLQSITITEEDYFKSTKNRKALFKLLETLVYKNTFLFIGYSFSDFDIRAIRHEIKEDLEDFSLWSYALWPNFTKEEEHYWHKYYIQLIDASFSHFMETLVEAKPITKKEEPTENIEEVVEAFLISLELKAPLLKKHCINVCNISIEIANKLNLNQQEKEELRKASLLHDIGFLKVSDSIYFKESPLTQAEYLNVINHTIVGENVLSQIPSLARLSKTVRHHHERYDGSGYPDGLKGNNIPLFARIIAAADTLDALTIERPYRKAMNKKEVVPVLKHCAGNQLDPHLVDVLLSVLEETKTCPCTSS